MQIYSKKKCFFSLISWPIFILFVLSDRARWGFVHKISNFNNYANLCKFIQNHKKITKNASSSFLKLGTKLGTLNFYTEFWDFAPW